MHIPPWLWFRREDWSSTGCLVSENPDFRPYDWLYRPWKVPEAAPPRVCTRPGPAVPRSERRMNGAALRCCCTDSITDTPSSSRTPRGDSSRRSLHRAPSPSRRNMFHIRPSSTDRSRDSSYRVGAVLCGCPSRSLLSLPGLDRYPALPSIPKGLPWVNPCFRKAGDRHRATHSTTGPAHGRQHRPQVGPCCLPSVHVGCGSSAFPAKTGWVTVTTGGPCRPRATAGGAAGRRAWPGTVIPRTGASGF